MNQAFLLAKTFSAIKFRYFPSGGVAKTKNCAPVQGETRIFVGFPPCARTQFRFFCTPLEEKLLFGCTSWVWVSHLCRQPSSLSGVVG